MLLSEAIRLGSMLHPQGFKSLSEGTFERVMGQIIGFQNVTATCALGAALEAVGKLPGISEEYAMRRCFRSCRLSQCARLRSVRSTSM